MIIPKKLKIGGHDVKVEFVEMRDSGQWDSYRGVISINKNQIRSVQEATFFHEIFHVLNSQFGATEPTHIILDSFAEQLYQVFKDNKILK